MCTSTLRAVASTAAPCEVILAGAAAGAQNLAPAGPGFQVESAPRPGGRPAVEGYIHSERYVWLSDVRVRVEVLNADGITVEEASGWVVGNIRPGGGDTSPWRSSGSEHPTE